MSSGMAETFRSFTWGDVVDAEIYPVYADPALCAPVTDVDVRGEAQRMETDLYSGGVVSVEKFGDSGVA